MGTPAFPNLGQHCSFSDCNLIDFLPFTCDLCHQVYCLEHRSYGTHQCPNAKDRDVTVLVCPLCTKAVRLVAKEDPNITWDRHVRTGCDPSTATTATKKARCPVPGCKEILSVSNHVVCRDCKQRICLKHRFGLDHNCQAQIKANKRENSFSHSFMRSFRVGGSPSPAPPTTPPLEAVRSRLQSAASSFANMFSKSSETPSEGTARGRSAPSSSSSSVPSSLKELCPQCGMRFGSVAGLIEHVESTHNRSSRRPNEEILDICPKCGQGFKDPILLVNHVERDHAGTSSNPRHLNS